VENRNIMMGAAGGERRRREDARSPIGTGSHQDRAGTGVAGPARRAGERALRRSSAESRGVAIRGGA
jgi:hypothetical protein